MKYGQEKSDLFIVALKPANKPGRLGAELVEPRERTEGNTGGAIHVPDTAPGKRVPEARLCTRSCSWDSPLTTQGGSPVRESRTPGSVRGVLSNEHSYRDKVSHSKGIANQTGPESCVAHREMRDEALTGEPVGQPLSRESIRLVQGADAVRVAEGNTDRHDKASDYSALRGLRPWHVGKLFAREPGDLLLGRLSCCRAVRVGKTRSRSR
jgi:hypothetical protein